METVSFANVFRSLQSKNPYDSFFKGVRLAHDTDVICYLQYLPARHVLIARGGKGLSSFENLGVNLALDKSFDHSKLVQSQSYDLLHDFVEGALERPYFISQTVGTKEDPQGVLLLASYRPLETKDFNPDWTDAILLIASHRMMHRKIEKFDQTCPDTDVLNTLGLQGQLTKELARSRRLKAPLSTIVYFIDHMEKHVMNMNGIQRKNWMVALSKILNGHSRVNDLVGRLGEGIFMVVLPHTPLEGAKVKALRMCQMISDSQLKVGGVTFKFTLSAVINEYPRISEDGDQLISKSLEIVKSESSTGSNRLFVAGTRAHFESDFDVES